MYGRTSTAPDLRSDLPLKSFVYESVPKWTKLRDKRNADSRFKMTVRPWLVICVLQLEG